jgi:hypothetical protein
LGRELELVDEGGFDAGPDPMRQVVGHGAVGELLSRSRQIARDGFV